MSEDKAVYEEPDKEGTSSGPCPFVVHTIDATEVTPDANIEYLKKAALLHVKGHKGKFLAITHSSQPESIFNNPQLYPQAFPWLFPYGLGGIGNKRGFDKLGDEVRKKNLLMYHDKRFQKDPYFPLVAFNHSQIKSSSRGGFLLAERKNFPQIAKRILNVNAQVLASLLMRMEKGEYVKPETPEEKVCYEVINDLDHVAHHVDNSKTNKKYMRNELWSTICSKGAPSWFITFAPTDMRHPLCLYYADDAEAVYPYIFEVKRLSKYHN